MAERIDQITYVKDDAEQFPGTELFYNGPTEFLAAKVAARLLEVAQWKALFGDQIIPYRKQDFSIRSLPALRVYNEHYEKEAESWFISGTLLCDVIWPANLRREERQLFPDTVSAALLQQFRRPGFFETLSVDIPGLNELGKTFSVDKSLGFNLDDKVVPLTQMIVNFRIDLRQWDLHLEQTNRTKDDPFEAVLGTLTKIATTVQGLKDDGEVGVEPDGVEQEIE